MSVAELIPSNLADEAKVRRKELAEWLGVTVATIAAWEAEGRLPKPRRVGPKTLIYNLGEVRAALRKLDEEPKRRKAK